MREMTLDEAGEILRRNGLNGMDVAYVGTMSRFALARRLAALEDALRQIASGEGLGDGCGDNSCIVRRRGGMATNGGCQCHEDNRARPLRMAVQRAKRLALAALDGEVGNG